MLSLTTEICMATVMSKKPNPKGTVKGQSKEMSIDTKVSK